MPLAALAVRLKDKASNAREVLAESVRLFKPDTLVSWHRTIVRRKWTFKQARTRGRPPVDGDLEGWILKVARDNPTLGYEKLEGELRKLGFEVGATTIRTVLPRHGVPPAPERSRQDQWHVHDDLQHGQLVKRHQNHKVKYTITRLLWGKRNDLYDLLEAHGFRRLIQTAFIERVNLTIRQGVSLLTRRTRSLPQTDQHLLNHVEWWRGYYHWIRPHQTLREPIPGETRCYRNRTPAMAFGLTDHIWTVENLLRTPVLTRLARSDPACLANRARGAALAA